MVFEFTDTEFGAKPTLFTSTAGELPWSATTMLALRWSSSPSRSNDSVSLNRTVAAGPPRVSGPPTGMIRDWT